jgi:phosphoadenosine phosphosulfate reductase
VLFYSKSGPKALGNSIWITGLRAEQSENRNDLHLFEYDGKFEIINPLLKWTLKDVEDYLENNVPQMHCTNKDLSIGCAMY